MNTIHLRALSRTALWLVASAVLAACGGGGGSSTPATVSGTSATGNSSASSSKTITVKMHFSSATRQAPTPSSLPNGGKGAAAQALAKLVAAQTSARKAFQAAHRMTASNFAKAAASSRKAASASRSPQYIDPYYTEGIAIFATDKGVGGAGPNTTLSTVYADVSDSDYTAGIESCSKFSGCYYLSPLCTFTDGGGVVGQGDPSEGWDCNIPAPGVPGHTVTYQAITVSDTPDNEASSGPGAGIGTGFSYGYELSIGTNTVPLNPTIATAVTITLDPINTFYCFGDDYNYSYLTVVPVDGNTHALSLSNTAMDAEEYPIYLQTAGAADVFAGPDGTVEPVSVTTGNSALLSPNSATISAPNSSSSYTACNLYEYPAILGYYTCQGLLYANFTYNGAASGTSGAEPILVTWNNQLSNATPLVGYGSGTGQNPTGPYQGFYEISDVANVIAPFDVTSSNQTLTASGPSTTLTVSLFCSGMAATDNYVGDSLQLDYAGDCSGQYNSNPTAYGCASNDYDAPMCFGTDIGSGVSGICPLSTVTVAGQVPTISSSLVVTQVFNATVTTSAAPPCIFHFTDEPAFYWWTGDNYDYDSSAAIQVEPASGAVFPIHLGNPPPTPGNGGG